MKVRALSLFHGAVRGGYNLRDMGYVGKQDTPEWTGENPDPLRDRGYLVSQKIRRCTPRYNYPGEPGLRAHMYRLKST